MGQERGGEESRIFLCGKEDFFSRWEECANFWQLVTIPPVVLKILDDLTYLRWFDDIYQVAQLACIHHQLLSYLPHNSFSYLLQRCQLPFNFQKAGQYSQLLKLISCNFVKLQAYQKLQAYLSYSIFYPCQLFKFLKLPNTPWKYDCLTHRSPGIESQTNQSLEKNDIDYRYLSHQSPTLLKKVWLYR